MSIYIFIHPYNIIMFLSIIIHSCLLSDVGFQRVGLDGTCTPMAGVQYPPPPPPECYEGGTYSYTSKYVTRYYGCGHYLYPH